jgi:PAS domain S-box-containing protein
MTGQPTTPQHDPGPPEARLRRAHAALLRLAATTGPGHPAAEAADLVAAVAGELTAHGRLQDALRHSEDRFAKAFHASAVAKTLTRLADRRLLEFNDAWLRLTGLPRDRVAGRSIDELGLWIDPAVRDGIYRRLWAGQPVVGEEVRMRLAAGTELFGLISAERIDLDNEPCSLWEFLDITARKVAEDEARRLTAVLERRVAERTAELAAANAELEAFCYSVSHDLRAPLRAIDGFSQALLEDCASDLDADGRNYLTRVRAASKRMGELIDDLLALSRVSRGEMRRARVDLSALAERVVSQLRLAHPGRDVDVVIEPGLTAEADPNLVRVALENLLGNAWKYTGKNPRARVEFGRAAGGEAAYYVRDDGAGFDPAYADKLFQPFQRLHRPDEFEGHGIGLATVQRIVRRHGGRAWADGTVGRGATFYFTLSEPSPASARQATAF